MEEGERGARGAGGGLGARGASAWGSRHRGVRGAPARAPPPMCAPCAAAEPALRRPRHLLPAGPRAPFLRGVEGWGPGRLLPRAPAARGRSWGDAGVCSEQCGVGPRAILEAPRGTQDRPHFR